MNQRQIFRISISFGTSTPKKQEPTRTLLCVSVRLYSLPLIMGVLRDVSRKLSTMASDLLPLLYYMMPKSSSSIFFSPCYFPGGLWLAWYKFFCPPFIDSLSQGCKLFDLRRQDHIPLIWLESVLEKQRTMMRAVEECSHQHSHWQKCKQVNCPKCFFFNNVPSEQSPKSHSKVAIINFSYSLFNAIIFPYQQLHKNCFHPY